MASNGTVHWDPAFLNQMRQKYNLPAPPKKGVPRPTTLPPPPPGTYDPALDYQAGAANRGLTYQQNDAQTQFEQGTEDYNAASKNLLTNEQRTLADLLTQEGDVRHNYTVLGHQQADAAAAHGITSAGLLALSASKRAANQAHDLAPLTLAESRTKEDYTTNKNALDAQYARTFGGFNGTTLTDPYTGQSVVGSLVTSLGRGGTENTFYQQGLLGQKVFQAQQGGYIAPSVQTDALGHVSPAQAAAFVKRRKKARA